MAAPAREPAVKNDWSSKPMPEQCTTIELSRQFSQAEMKRIRYGFIPQEMEEKWFIYYEPAENKLYLHRSWTGMCIYVVQFEETEGEWRAVSAVVNRDPEQYRSTNDDEDEKSLWTVVNAVLLGAPGYLGGSPLEAWSMLGRHSMQ